MKKFYRIMAMLLTIVMLTTTLASCNVSDIISGIVNPETPPVDDIEKPHYCESKCPKCGKSLFKGKGSVLSCLDEKCGYKATATKKGKKSE